MYASGKMWDAGASSPFPDVGSLATFLERGSVVLTHMVPLE